MALPFVGEHIVDSEVSGTAATSHYCGLAGARCGPGMEGGWSTTATLISKRT